MIIFEPQTMTLFGTLSSFNVPLKLRRSLLTGLENVLERNVRPEDCTGFFRKPYGSTLDAPTKPVKKVRFIAFDNYRITSDAEDVGQCTVRRNQGQTRRQNRPWQTIRFHAIAAKTTKSVPTANGRIELTANKTAQMTLSSPKLNGRQVIHHDHFKRH